MLPKQRFHREHSGEVRGNLLLSLLKLASFFSVFAAVSSLPEGEESLVSLESLQRKVILCVFKALGWAEELSLRAFWCALT